MQQENMVIHPTENMTSSKNLLWFIIGTVGSWLTFWFFLASPFGLLLWLGILVYLIVKKSRVWLYVALSAWLFVPSCSFVRGTIEYARGKATLQGEGMMSFRYAAIDRETRVPETTSGCILIGFEPFVHLPNNAAVRLMTNLFGYQPGSYMGAYPTEEEAVALMAQADTVRVERKDRYYVISAQGTTTKFDSLKFRKLGYSQEDFPMDTILANTMGDECLIFRQWDAGNKGEVLLLADIREGRVFAGYPSRE